MVKLGADVDIVARGGGLDVVAPALAEIRLLGCRPEVTYRRGGRVQTWRPAIVPAGDGCEAISASPDLEMRLAWQRQGGAVTLHATLRNVGRDRLAIVRIAPLALDESGECQVGRGADRWSVFRQGYQSWTGTRSFRMDEVDRDPWSAVLKIGLIDICNPSPQRAGHFRSDMFAVIKNLGSGEVFVAGCLTNRVALGGVELRVREGACSRLAVVLDYDGIPLEPGAQIAAEPVWLAAGRNEHELLGEYAGAVGAAMRARVPARSPIGWCSWYYYFREVTEEAVLLNLRELTALRARFPCDYVQIDDGYQSEIGDWLTANEKFPHGMAWLSEQIRHAGFDAGIWTAPFIARSGSRLLAEHPDWFVKNRRGRPRFALYNPLWGRCGNCHALDTTHPQVLEWLRRTFRTIAREWGYRVLKLDFLFAAALPGRRYDSGATRAGALRLGLEAVREGAGEGAFLLGCGCPLSPAIGLVDAMRIGPDVAPFWSNFGSRLACRDLHGVATKHAVRNALTRAFIHRKWWLNDPDCLMVRDTSTELTPAEVQSLATVIAATDGMIVLSDRVDQLPEERLALIERTLDLCGGQVEVVDLMGSDLPELLVARSPHRTVVAAFNFTDREQSKTVSLGGIAGLAPVASSASEWWSGRPVSIVDGQVALPEVPAHGCRVLVFPTAPAVERTTRPERD